MLANLNKETVKCRDFTSGYFYWLAMNENESINQIKEQSDQSPVLRQSFSLRHRLRPLPERQWREEQQKVKRVFKARMQDKSVFNVVLRTV